MLRISLGRVLGVFPQSAGACLNGAAADYDCADRPMCTQVLM
jgi:hypothetical protein